MAQLLYGNTYRFNAEFKTFAGAYGDLADPVVNIYDGAKVLIHTGLPTQISTGRYAYVYTIPATESGPLVVEFAGTLEGVPIVARLKITRKWV